MITLLMFITAYLMGSIPFGLIITRMAGLGDVRAIGSGNIGATNVMRTGNRKLGILTLLCDMGKGAAAVCMARAIGAGDFVAVAGGLAILGHVFPVWLKFRGGKGVATTIGVFLALSWLLGAAVCIVWLLAFYVSRMASLASIIAIGYSPIVAFVLGDKPLTLLCMATGGLVVYAHRANIKRIRAGTEPKFGEKAA